MEPFAFRISGALVARTLRKAITNRTRPLEGWLFAFGILGPNGGVIPTTDRDGQFTDAASAPGKVDVTEYLKKGLWNDTHNRNVIVGRSDGLEFHDGTTPLSLSHQKIGYYTAGHLFDPSNPVTFGDYSPTPFDLERSDYYWELANETLSGGPRSLAFSADGWMWCDQTGTHIVRARIDQSAICETPVNPLCTAEVVFDGSDPAQQLAKAIRRAAKHSAAELLASLPTASKDRLLRLLAQRYPWMTDKEIQELLDQMAEAHAENNGATHV